MQYNVRVQRYASPSALYFASSGIKGRRCLRGTSRCAVYLRVTPLDHASSASHGPSVSMAGKLPSQADTLFNPDRQEEFVLAGTALKDRASKSVADLDYLTELLAIQQDDGPKNLGFFGTRNMGLTHQKLVEILSYAMVSAGNHIYTSGATGTNAAVIKGALRAEAPDLLTVILPQSLRRQPQESQELLAQVQNVVEMPENDGMTLLESSRICNRQITGHVQQVICFAFHDSRLLLETCQEAKDNKKIVTLFYLD